MNSQLSQSASDFGNRLVQFEAEWSSGQIPDVASYLRAASDKDRKFIEDLIEIDLESRWKRFDADSDPSARDLHGFPQFPLVEDYAAILSQSLQHLIFTPRCIAEEYRARSRWGDRPSKESILKRFPSDQTEIDSALQEIDTDFINKGIHFSEESSQSISAEFQPTVILERSARKDSRLVPETRLIGTEIGKYRLETRLGHGSFGEVWKAHDPDLNRHVAIKFPRLDKHYSPELLESFRTEARKLAALDHFPNGIVDVYDCGEQDGKPYFVSKLIKGESLADRMQRKKLSHEESAELIAKVAATLKRAHKEKLVHRDIKPANILLDEEGEPYLADFGMAATEEEQLSEGHGILGTISYMAPEQARGDSHRVDGRADIYALGVVLYRLLTNELPYGGKDIPQYLDNIQHQKPRPPRQLDEAIPAELEQICLKCLQKAEDDRYSSASELCQALNHITPSARTSFSRTILIPLAGIVIAASLFALIGRRETSVPTKTEVPEKTEGPETKTVSNLAHPELVAWSPYDSNDAYRYLPDENVFQFDAFGHAVFKLQDIQEKEVQLRMNYSLKNKLGYAGLFWCLNPATDANQHCWAVLAGCSDKQGQYVIQIYDYAIRNPGGSPQVRHHLLKRIPIERPEFDRITLIVNASISVVHQIWMNGTPLLENPYPLPDTDWSEYSHSGVGVTGQLGTISIYDFAVD